LSVFVPYFVRSLRARRLSGRTIDSYDRSCRLFIDWLILNGQPTEATKITRAIVESYIVEQIEAHKPATACARYNALAQLFGWLAEEDIILESPMVKMRRPKVPIPVTRVLQPDDLKKLLATAPAKSKDFLDVRDRCIILLFGDTGLRLSELAGLKLTDVDRDTCRLQIVGKGDKTRTVAYGVTTATALDRYWLARSQQKYADLDRLWITRQGYATTSAIYRVIANRARIAGLGEVHPHQLRHSWAHAELASGASEGDVMALGGWSNRKMLERYGHEQAANRALAAYRRNGGPMDWL
jgi:site-specific recombinase XerD